MQIYLAVFTYDFLRDLCRYNFTQRLRRLAIRRNQQLYKVKRIYIGDTHIFSSLDGINYNNDNLKILILYSQKFSVSGIAP